MTEPTLYLFDGYNLLHAGGYEDPRQLRDTLASFAALKGARGVLVFDGVGTDETHGPLEVRFAEHADTVRRPSNPNSPLVRELLRQLERAV